MRFMIIRKSDVATEAGRMPVTEEIDRMMQYNQQLVDAGVMVEAHGLQPTSNATRVHVRSGQATLEYGPFADVSELIAGYTIIDVRSRREALEWVRRWPELNVDLELRQLYADEDFADAAMPELRAQEARLRARTEQQVSHG